MYLLYLATCFSSPPLILAGEAGLPEKGGGFAHLDLRPVGSRVAGWRQRGLRLGECPLLCPQWEEPGLLLLFASAVLRVRWKRVEGRIWERKKGIVLTPPTKA